MHIDKVIDGIARYIDGEIYSNMNDWQELIARMAVGRVLENKAVLKQKVMDNPYLMSFVLVDSNGDMDVDRFLGDLKGVISQKGAVQMELPLFGKMKFVPDDVDVLRRYIERG